MIKAFIIGRLGKDCNTNKVNENTVINFAVAHSEKFKDASGTMKDKTIWADCAYWTEKVGVVPYLKKGTQVYVEGTPDVKAYTTSDGKRGATLIIRVHSVQLLGSKDDNNDSSAGIYPNTTSTMNSSNQNTSSNSPTEEDDLPF